jgi:hypothetical protein
LHSYWALTADDFRATLAFAELRGPPAGAGVFSQNPGRGCIKGETMPSYEVKFIGQAKSSAAVKAKLSDAFPAFLGLTVELLREKNDEEKIQTVRDLIGDAVLILEDLVQRLENSEMADSLNNLLVHLNACEFPVDDDLDTSALLALLEARKVAKNG